MPASRLTARALATEIQGRPRAAAANAPAGSNWSTTAAVGASRASTVGSTRSKDAVRRAVRHTGASGEVRHRTWRRQIQPKRGHARRRRGRGPGVQQRCPMAARNQGMRHRQHRIEMPGIRRCDQNEMRHPPPAQQAPCRMPPGAAGRDAGRADGLGGCRPTPASGACMNALRVTARIRPRGRLLQDDGGTGAGGHICNALDSAAAPGLLRVRRGTKTKKVFWFFFFKKEQVFFLKKEAKTFICLVPAEAPAPRRLWAGAGARFFAALHIMAARTVMFACARFERSARVQVSACRLPIIAGALATSVAVRNRSDRGR